mmetsp:Transcript_18658/g.30429  ORF Transcript_18658/g.30429 Transcript_18658/m.30429 type:complete len:273 (+) Transcript_18658:146-964(+)
MADSGKRIVTICLAGQSNMSGRAGLNRKEGKWVWDESTTKLAEQFELLSGQHEVVRMDAAGEWQIATEPLHVDIDTKKTCGIGPGLMMAREIQNGLKELGSKEENVNVRLIPCAIGETAIAAWEKGENLYDQMLSRVKGQDLSCFVWYQGESDALNKETADAYKSCLTKLFKSIRTDLAAPQLHIVVVKPVGTPVRLPFIESVSAQSLEVASEDACCTAVDIQPSKSSPELTVPSAATGQPVPLLRVDNVHLTIDAQHYLSQLVARAIIDKL